MYASCVRMLSSDVLFVCVSISTLDSGQHYHFYLWEHGRSVPQTPDGAGAEADLPRHLQLHQVTHQAGVREAATGLLPNVI